MYCKYCGEKMDEDVRYCGMCGKRLAPAAEPPTAQYTRRPDSLSRILPVLAVVGVLLIAALGLGVFLIWSSLRPVPSYQPEGSASIMGAASEPAETTAATTPTQATTAPAETTVPETTAPETTPPETTVPETVTTTPPAAVPPSPRNGYVVESSGGLKIRSGPGLDYPEVGRLAPNAPVSVYESTVVGTSNWGRIGTDQWVCTDYVVFSDLPQRGAFSLELPEAYTQILHNYGTAIRNQYDRQQMEAIGLNPDLSDFIGSETLGYTAIDLDGNGSKELLIGVVGDVGAYGGSNGMFFDLYTLRNGGPIRVIAGRARDSFFLCQNGLIAEEGSGGAALGMFYYYRFDPNAIDSLEMIEAVIYNDMYNYDYLPYDAGPWYYTIQDPRIYGEEQGLISITSTDVDRIWAEYAYASIPYAAIPEY